MMCGYFTDTCVVAERDGELLGFATGFRSPKDPDIQLVWRIVVAHDGRGTGLGGRMLSACLRAGHEPATWWEATVTPDNDGSARMFSGFAR